MSDGLPDLSSLSPEDQQNLFALSTEEERQNRLAHAKAQAQALMEKQKPIDALTPLAGAFEGISNAANSIGGRVRSDDADAQGKAMDAQHVSGLQALMRARQDAYAQNSLDGLMATGAGQRGQDARSAISGIGPDLGSMGAAAGMSPDQRILIDTLLKKQPGQQLADAPTSHDFGMAV